MNESKDMQPVRIGVVVNLSKERIDYQMAAVGGIRIEFFVVVLVVNIM